MLCAGLHWFRPYLAGDRQVISSVPDPEPVFALSEFPIAPHQQACLNSVTVDPNSRIAEFHLRLAEPSRSGGPPVELVLSAPGYRGVVEVPGGYAGGTVSLPMKPPARSLIGSACFINRGRTTVLFDGTTEARSLSRSSMVIAGKPVVGDIALTFLDGSPRSLLDGLGEVFGHASTLTDRFVPVWLIWLLAVIVALGVPLGVLAAFYLALRQDEVAARR
jgi:hypothetical protein